MSCGGDNPISNFQMTQQPLILALDVYRKYELRFSDFDKFSSQIQKAVNPMRHQCNKIVHLKSKFTKYPNFETYLQIQISHQPQNPNPVIRISSIILKILLDQIKKPYISNQTKVLQPNLHCLLLQTIHPTASMPETQTSPLQFDGMV